MARPAIAVALPGNEAAPVAAELRAAGFTVASISRPEQLEALLASRRDVAVAILDGETDLDQSLEYYSLLRDAGRAIPALMVMSRARDDAPRGRVRRGRGRVLHPARTRPSRCAGASRPCASAARPSTTDRDPSSRADRSRPTAGRAARRSSRSSTRRAASARRRSPRTSPRSSRRGAATRSCSSTPTPSPAMSRRRSASTACERSSDSWRDQAEGGPRESLDDIASAHPSGMRVAALTSSPLDTDILEPDRVADEITAARRGVDFIVVDLHPSYGKLNHAIFEVADRILVPVTPDVPAIRAAVQLADVRHRAGRPRAAVAGRSTGRTAASASPTSSGPSGCRRSP